MEYLALSSSKLSIVPCLSTAKDVEIRRWSPFPLLSVLANGRGMRRSNFFSSGSSSIRCENRHEPSQIISRAVMRKIGLKNFASISSSNISEISTVCTAPQTTVPPPPYYFGSPLFWVGVGVGLSALFSLVSTRVKQYAMQQAFKTMISQTPQNGELSDATFPDVRPFSFPSTTQSSPSISLTPNFTLQPVAVEDHPPTKIEDSPPPIESKEQSEREPKKYAFVDVSPTEVLSSEYAKEPFSQIESQSEEEVSQNGAPYKTEHENFHQQSETSTSGSALSVQALEKMMEDPNVQKLVYPYLPEEMRNPTSFKWMLQNPQYRQQLQDMLNKMGGSRNWENLMVGTLKNFDLSNPQIKEQFDQIGLTPEQVISKIMANPDVALAFQNPKVQAALMDCTQNPLGIAKYQNDKEEYRSIHSSLQSTSPSSSPHHA